MTLEDELKQLKDRHKELEVAYFEARKDILNKEGEIWHRDNPNIEIGDKVVVGNKHEGIFGGLEQGNRPIVYKIKKDGTQSQHRIFTWYSDKITKNSVST